MANFKQSLLDALEDNRLEMLMPSREYTDNEIIWMRGYQQALEDMLCDYDNDIEDAIQDGIISKYNLLVIRFPTRLLPHRNFGPSIPNLAINSNKLSDSVSYTQEDLDEAITLMRNALIPLIDLVIA